MKILGAGLAGCIASALNQNAEVFEATDGSQSHQALLRFRSPDIGEAVGIPFKKVKVYKGIWHNDQSVPVTPRAIALYSRKVADNISYRSICNIDTVERWIAPTNFHQILKDQCHNRIRYNTPFTDFDGGEPIISTLPISVLSKFLYPRKCINTEHSSSEIFVSRYILKDSDVHMTYYYTDPTVLPYRASISGNVLIIESKWEIREEDVKVVVRSFGLSGVILEPESINYRQKNGKIIPINEKHRRDFIVNASIEHNVYSLGRFATWRNLVLDDVYKDILVIKKLINKDKYHHYKEMNQ